MNTFRRSWIEIDKNNLGEGTIVLHQVGCNPLPQYFDIEKVVRKNGSLVICFTEGTTRKCVRIYNFGEYEIFRVRKLAKGYKDVVIYDVPGRYNTLTKEF